MSTSKNGKYAKIKTASSKIATYTKTGLTKNKNYYFKVRSFKTINGSKVYSDLSSVKSVKVK